MYIILLCVIPFFLKNLILSSNLKFDTFAFSSVSNIPLPTIKTSYISLSLWSNHIIGYAYDSLKDYSSDSPNAIINKAKKYLLKYFESNIEELDK